MLKVINAGLYASIQDLGRYNFLEYGVPFSGAMDHYSAKLANLLIGNAENDAVLEVTFNGSFEFVSETIICISGANLHAQLNNTLLATNCPVKVEKGSILRCSNPIQGARAYVAVKGGFLNKKVLGSRSFFKEITKKHFLQKDDEIFYEPFVTTKSDSFSSVKIDNTHFDTPFIEAYKGPEFELLNTIQREFLKQTRFTISKEHNRMGYRLSETLENTFNSMLTSSVLPGTVQLTPSGTLIVLMRDCGVTGGYPRILQLTEDAINKMAQKGTNDRFEFKLVDLNT